MLIRSYFFAVLVVVAGEEVWFICLWWLVDMQSIMFKLCVMLDARKSIVE